MNQSITFRKAILQDIERVWQIILQAKEQMRLRKSKQWQNGYPAIENITHDIKNGYGYVLWFNNCIIAYGAVIFDGEPAYQALKGKWITDRPYVVVHRLAVANEMKQRGIATLFMQKVEELCLKNKVSSFRVDTNFDNLYMQKILSKLGFTHCGEIMYDNDARMAYEKRLFQENP